MPTLLPIDEGLKAMSDDVPGSARAVTNWMTDNAGMSRVRPGLINSVLNPGVYVNATTAGTGIIGVYVWKNVGDSYEYAVYVRADRQIFALNLTTMVTASLSTAGVPSTLLDGNSRAVFAEDTVRLIIAGGGQMQTWTGSGVSARLATYSSPTNVPPLQTTHVVKLANYIVANNVQAVGQFAWSSLGDGNDGTWPALNFNTADADPDPIIALHASIRELYAFGTRSLQVFAISPDPLLPFQSSASLPIGCGAPYSVIRADDNFAWFDDRRRFGVSDGRSFTHISADIDKILRDIVVFSDCYGFRCNVGYWNLFVWVFPTDGRAFAYDQNQQKWFVWQGWNGVDGFSALRLNAHTYWNTGALHIVGDPQFENLFTLDINSRADSAVGQPIVCERVTGRIDWGTTTRKRSRRIRFFVSRGNTPTTSTQPALLEVAKRDDDSTWQTSTLNLGYQGDSSSFVDWYPGGVYRRRQYRIRYSGTQDITLTSAEESLLPCVD